MRTNNQRMWHSTRYCRWDQRYAISSGNFIFRQVSHKSNKGGADHSILLLIERNAAQLTEANGWKNTDVKNKVGCRLCKTCVHMASSTSLCLIWNHYNTKCSVTNKNKLSQFESGFRIRFPSLFTSFNKRKVII